MFYVVYLRILFYKEGALRMATLSYIAMEMNMMMCKGMEMPVLMFA